MMFMSSPLGDMIKAGSPITVATLERLKKSWCQIYLALFLIKSHGENKVLENMKLNLAEANEAVMTFFDDEIKRLEQHG